MIKDKEFDGFYRRHLPQVTRYVVRRLRSEVDDIVEEVFITAWRKRKTLPPVASEQIFWLYATARRVIANKLRFNSRLDRFNQSEAPLLVESNNGESEDTSFLVHTTLRQMRAKDREVLMLVDWDGCSINEAAIVLEITSSAMGKRIAAARKAFAEIYQKE